MCYVLKRERLFTEYPDLLNLQNKNRIIKFGVSNSAPGASGYFADYIGKVILEDLKKLVSKANFSQYCLMEALIQLLLNKRQFMFFLSVRVTCT